MQSDEGAASPAAPPPAAMAALVSRSLRGSAQLDFYGEENIRRLEQEIFPPSYFAAKASAAESEILESHRAGGLAGLLVLLLREKHAEVDALFVDPRHFARGIGRGLLERAEERAKVAGHFSMEAHAAVTAQGFWEKCGFKAVGEEATSTGTLVLMRKELLLRTEQRAGLMVLAPGRAAPSGPPPLRVSSGPPVDAEELAALVSRSLRRSSQLQCYGEESIRMKESRVFSPAYFVAHAGNARANIFRGYSDGGGLVAILVLVFRQADAKVDALFVEPACFSRGFGRALLRHAEEFASELRPSGVRNLEAHAALTAQGFWKRCGYEAVGREETDTGPLVVMSKPLPR